MTESTYDFQTPGGKLARMWVREGTNDRMVAEACIEQDEYRTADTDARAVLDIGGHIGSWTVGYLLDHPDAEAVIVEPLPENARMIARNLAENRLAERSVVVVGALSRDTERVRIAWDFSDAEGAEMHRYIGGQRMPDGVKHATLDADGYPLSHLTRLVSRGRFDVVKIDCEGGEASLVGQECSVLGLIVGEYHIPRDPLWLWLARTHDVTMQGEDTFGSFRAVPR